MNGSDDEGQENVQSGDVLPPEEQGQSQPPLSQNILALISNYTERPDLFFEALEKHDPGFIKRMNQKAEKFSEKTQDTKFYFSTVQAYSSLAISTIVPFAILYVLYLHISGGEPKFWTIIGLTAFFAVSQGGKGGFISIAKGIANLFQRE